ncbi:hypothetical protein Nos7107_4093 [Nostoc sp. PCC 7107]|nr:hypothetical protein Nos7107_4093 [Nostoc sp. PCC 7107]
MKLIFLNFSLLKLIKYSLFRKNLMLHSDSLGIKFIALIELLCDRSPSCQSDRWRDQRVLVSTTLLQETFKHPVQNRALLYLQLRLRS